jgi:hypothetical protein
MIISDHIHTEILLVTCEFKKCDFILIHSPNLNQFQLIALILMLTAFLLSG